MIRTIAAATMAVACLAAPLAAQTFPLKMTGQHGGLFKGRTKIAIGSYGINFIVGQKASAVAGVGLNARVVTGLKGVDEATMRRLADEGYADLRAQLAAAGIVLASEEETRGAIREAGATLLPGNTDSGRDGGLVIGKGVKKAYLAFGAAAAPLTDLFAASGKTGPFAMLATMGKGGKLNRPGEAIDATFIFPTLTVDYADSEVKVGRSLAGNKRGTVETDIAFGIRTDSPVNVQNPAKMGMGTPGAFRPVKDVWTDQPFTRGATSVSAQAQNAPALMDTYSQKADGDVVVDAPAWTALVQQAYRDYNAAIVAVVREQKAKG